MVEFSEDKWGMMELEWAKEPVDAPLTEKEIGELKFLLKKKAAEGNVFHISVKPSAWQWIEQHVKNAHVLVFAKDIEGDGKDWCIIGNSEETVNREAARI